MSEKMEQAASDSWFLDAFYNVACKVNDVVPGLGPALYQIGNVQQVVAEGTVAVGLKVGLGL